MRIIDAECHAGAESLQDLLGYLDPGWAERLTRNTFALPPGSVHPGGGKTATGAYVSARETSDRLAPEVAAAVLVPHQAMPIAGWADTMTTVVYTSALNSYLIEKWLPVDERFRLAIAVSPHEPHLAAAEIDRHASRPEVVAVCMPMLATHLGQTAYRPILEACARHGLALMIHPSGREGTIIGAPKLGGIGPRHKGEYNALIFQVAAANLASVVYDGVFSEWPNLKIVFLGFGFEWAPGAVWHVDMEWRNLRIDIPWVKEPPSHYIARNIRLGVSDFSEAPVEYITQIAGIIPAESLIYASNTPFTGDRLKRLLDMLPENRHAGFLAGNAENTFSRLAPVVA